VKLLYLVGYKKKKNAVEALGVMDFYATQVW
jgi:hypothetical protein